jgi:hypothetical protein
LRLAHAHTGQFQRHFKSGIMLHGCPSGKGARSATPETRHSTMTGGTATPPVQLEARPLTVFSYPYGRSGD